MTDQWVPAPPVVPLPPGDPLPPANSWNPTPPCSSGDNPSIVDGVVITGVPATISAPYAWSITLNDGSSPANFSINRNDSSNNLIDQPIQASGANGQITFPNAIFVNGMQADGNIFVDGVMTFTSLSNLQLPGGTAGQVLTASGAAGFVNWANLPAPPIAADAPLDGNLYGRSNGTWSSGGRITQPLSIYGSNMFALLADMGQPRSILAGTGSTVQNASWRWQMQLADYSTEAGNNSGSNFVLTPFSDTGNPLPTALTINRATGSAVFQGPTQILAPFGNTPALGLVKYPSNGVAAIVGQASTGLPRWQLYLGDYSAELGGNLGSNFRIDRFNDDGSLNGVSPLLINRASGLATFGYGVTITGNLVATNAQFTGQLVLNSGPSQFQLGGGQADQVLTTNGLGSLYWSTVTGGGAGGIEEAPVDGTTYARNDAAWVHLISADISDLGSVLGDYLPLIGGALSGNLTISSGGLTVSAGQTNVQALNVNGTTSLGGTTVSGVMLFMGVAPTLTNPPTSAMQVTNKGYVDGLAGATPPLMDGTAAVGAGTTWSRTDHVHPTDTTRAAVTALPPASTVVPLVDGVGAVGVSTAYARADHIHPLPPQAIGDNRIINGDMRIDQRHDGVASEANPSYTVDRWQYISSQAGYIQWGRNIGPPSSLAPGFPYCLGCGALSAYTSLPADYFVINQSLEADAISDFAWGTANAQPVTLSFWARSSLTGIFSGAIQNYAGTRSYPFTFSLPTVNTWTKIAITVPGDTAGTWVMSGNGGALTVVFDLGTGATYRGPAGAWANGPYNGVTGAVNILSSINATFYVTGVKLEIGSVATPYNRQSLAKSMADCQRYYCQGQFYSAGTVTASQPVVFSYGLPVSMRAMPTLGISTNNSTNLSSPALAAMNPRDIYGDGTATATGATAVNFNFTASAEL